MSQKTRFLKITIKDISYLQSYQEHMNSENRGNNFNCLTHSIHVIFTANRILQSTKVLLLSVVTSKSVMDPKCQMLQ